MDIGDWREQNGLGKYASVFAENEIDFIACPSSKQMGLLSVFHKGGSGASLFDVKLLSAWL